MAVTDRSGSAVAAGITSASRVEVTFFEEALGRGFRDVAPDLLTRHETHDSDEIDARLWNERHVELIFVPDERKAGAGQKRTPPAVLHAAMEG
jgi:hypothetical protein